MKRVAARRSLYCAADVALIGGNILVLKPDPDERLVMIRPWRMRRFVAPIRALPHDNPLAKCVEGEHVLPAGVLPQKKDEISEDRADAAFVVKLEIGGPAMW